MSKTGIGAILAIGLLAGSAVGVVAQEQGAEEADPLASLIPIEELALPSISPLGSGPSTFTWDAEEWDHTRDPESGLELRILRIEATEPRAAGWVFTLDDRVEALDGDHDYGILGSLAKLSNDGGAWLGTWRGVSGNAAQGEFAEFTGEEGYAGLAMYLFTLDSGDARDGIGFIVPADAIPPFPEEGGSGQVPDLDTGDLFCVRASDEVEADRLQEAVVAEAVTITVVARAECVPDAALGAQAAQPRRRRPDIVRVAKSVSVRKSWRPAAPRGA